LEPSHDDGGFGFLDYEAGDQNVGPPPPLLPLTATDMHPGFFISYFRQKIYFSTGLFNLTFNIINIHFN